MKRVFAVFLGTAVALTISGSGAAEGTFRLPDAVQYDVYQTRSLAIADATGDGRLDAVLSAQRLGNAAELHVLAQQPDGALRDAVQRRIHCCRLPVLDMPVEAGDFTGDGRADVAVGLGHGIDVLLGGSSGLGEATLVPAVGSVAAIVARNITGDRKAELVVAGYSRAGGAGPGVFVLTRTRRGFRAHRIDRSRLSDLKVGDLNGDGRLDIAGLTHRGVNKPPPDIVVLLAAPNGSFVRRTFHVKTKRDQYLEALAILDITGDGRNDIVATGNAEHKPFIYLLAQAGDARLRPISPPKFVGGRSLTTGDVNCDGLVDLVAVQTNWMWITPLFTLGVLGSLPGIYGLPHLSVEGAKAAEIGDLNSDYRPDIAIANHDGLAVFYNHPDRPTPGDEFYAAICSPLRLSDLRGEPRRVRPGQVLRVVVRVRDARGLPLARGRVSCYLEYAEQSRQRIRPLEERLTRGVASCRWRIPPRARTLVQGALTVTAGRNRAHAAYRFYVR